MISDVMVAGRAGGAALRAIRNEDCSGRPSRMRGGRGSVSEGRCRAPSLRAADLRLIDQSAVANAVSLLNAKHRGGDGGSISQLDAIAGWVDTLVKDPAMNIGTIAKRENLAERHVRFLTPLAYLSPRIIEAIAEGRAPADLTVTRLVRNLPAIWVDQEEQLGFA